MNPAVEKARFQLTLQNYPTERTIREACELIYGMQDKNLIASLSSVPYIVGRSFSWEESIFFHDQLKNLGIAHSLISNDPTVDSLYYDPHKKAPLPKTPEASIAFPEPKKKKTLAKYLIFAIAFAGGYGVLELSKYLSNKENSSSSTTDSHEARLEKIFERVEYRSNQDISWKEAKINTGLDFGDAIRTFDDSSAHLRYREGSLLIIRPKTLMVIGRPEATKQSISLEDGQVQARLQASEKPKTFSIKTPAGILNLISPKPGDISEARIDTSVANGKVEIAVTSGKASLVPLSGERKTVEIQSLQKISGDSLSISSAQSFVPPVRLGKPEANHIFTVDPQKNESLVFEWEDLGENSIYSFEVLTAPDSEEPLLKRDIKDSRIELTYLDLGHLYWRVTGKKDSVTFVSETRPLHVKKRNE